MAQLSQAQMKRLTAVHGWSGTVLGLLLYVVVLTGTVVVFAHEIEHWSIGGASHEEPITGGIDATVRALVESVPRGYRGEVSVYGDEDGRLNVFPHAEVRHPETGETEANGTLFQVDMATGEVVGRRTGFVFHDTDFFIPSALADFLIGLHIRLYVPMPWGYLLTGVLGLLMISTGISGLLMHRHIVRDLFVSARPGTKLVTFRDRHVLAGSWGLVFAFLLGFTGAYFSFAGTVVFPLLTEVAFGGDEDRAVETLFVPRTAPDETPVPPADLDAIVADATARIGVAPTFVTIQNYGRRDALVQSFHSPPEGALEFVRPVYDGATGAFLYERPNIGREPSSGSFLRGLMWPLHTGDFAGALSKSVWVGLGSAMVFLVISGLRLWVRRREDDRLWMRFGRSVTAVAYGLPLAILICAYGYFLSRAAGADTFWWTPAAFLAGIPIGLAPAFTTLGETALRRSYGRLLGAGCLVLPVLRLACGGLDWASAIAGRQFEVIGIDIALIFLGAGLILWAVRSGTRARVGMAEPAE